jgi:CheY-like chemotaxis protein
LSRRYELDASLSSRLSLNSRKIPENRDVPAPEVCNDPHMPGTALVVDDHPSFRRLARKLLEAAGYRVVDEAGDGAAALASVKEFRPDVVLLDVLLPDTTGFELAETLTSDPAGPAPAVVLTSSRSASDFENSIASTSARGFISKRDLTPARLLALLEVG